MDCRHVCNRSRATSKEFSKLLILAAIACSSAESGAEFDDEDKVEDEDDEEVEVENEAADLLESDG